MLKLLLLIAVISIASIFVFGIKLEIGSILWTVLRVAFGVFLIYIVLWGIKNAFFKPPPFSPTESFKEKLIRVAEISKPFNVFNLYLRGEDMRVYSKWGKITGLLFIPYLCSVPEKNEKGEPILIDKIDKKTGKIFKDINGNTFKVPKMKLMTEKEGDWLFVAKRGWWIFGKKELIRANRELVSPIGNSIWIKDVNVVPIGDYFYPAKQWQKDILRILSQHQAETVIETHMEFLDLVAHVTQMSLGGDPTFQKFMESESERISNKSAGMLVRE